MKTLLPVETTRLVKLLKPELKANFQSSDASLPGPLLRMGPPKVVSSWLPTSAGALSSLIRSTASTVALVTGLTSASAPLGVLGRGVELVAPAARGDEADGEHEQHQDESSHAENDGTAAGILPGPRTGPKAKLSRPPLLGQDGPGHPSEHVAPDS